jgi:K+-sensing histidine kinase KdpD
MPDHISLKPPSSSQLFYATAIVLPVALGAALYPARGHLVPANLALLFVVCTVVIAGLGHRGAALVAAVVSGLSFDYFCTVPYLTLRMSRPQDITSTLLLIAVGLIVGQIAAGARQARSRATATGDRLGRVQSLGHLAATGADSAFLELAVSREISDLLHLKACRFIESDAPGVHTRFRSDGTVSIGQLPWAVERYGLPTKQVALPVRSAGQTLGTFLLTPTPTWPVDRENCVTAVALADELGAAIDARSVPFDGKKVRVRTES